MNRIGRASAIGASVLGIIVVAYAASWKGFATADSLVDAALEIGPRPSGLIRHALLPVHLCPGHSVCLGITGAQSLSPAVVESLVTQLMARGCTVERSNDRGGGPGCSLDSFEHATVEIEVGPLTPWAAVVDANWYLGAFGEEHRFVFWWAGYRWVQAPTGDEAHSSYRAY